MSNHTQTTTRLGTIFLPKSGTSVGQFDFVVDPQTGRDVQIDTPVAADTTEGTVIGVVIDMRTIGSAADPIAVDYDDQPGVYSAMADYRGDAKLATVQIFYSPALRSVSAGHVRSVTPEEMLKALGADRIEAPVSAGVVELSGGQYAKAVLDMHTLLGPESAHLMVGGLSGQAAKTSYAGVLLRSAIHAGSAERDSVAAVIFNVKGEDLVNLHMPPAAGYELSDTDRAIYEAMGVPSTPFDDVDVYAPSLPGGGGTRSARQDAIPLRWDLRRVWPYLKYFSPGLYSNENMSAFLGDVAAYKLYADNPADRLSTFNRLTAWIESEIAEAEEAQRNTGWRNHHLATMRRAAKIIDSLPGRCGGLLSTSETRDNDDVPLDAFCHGKVIVVDIAGLEPLVQSAVIARTCERILERAEKEGLGVDHLVLFAEEMNVYAPKDGGEMEAVRRILTKIAATGRYAGISLWGAAQFLSQVSPQITGNAATRAIGIISDSEADSGVYGRLSPGQRERIVTLPKGRMAIKAYNLRGMLTVAFPRPAWRTGRPKGAASAGLIARRGEATDTLKLREQSLARVTEGVPADLVERVIATHDGDHAGAVAALERLREPDMAKVSVERASTYDAHDPWGLG